MSGVIGAAIWDGVDLAPTSGDTLEAVRDEMVIAGPGREARLRRQIQALGERYDLVVIDTHPSLDQLTADPGRFPRQAPITPTRHGRGGVAHYLRTVPGRRAHRR